MSSQDIVDCLVALERDCIMLSHLKVVETRNHKGFRKNVNNCLNRVEELLRPGATGGNATAPRQRFLDAFLVYLTGPPDGDRWSHRVFTLTVGKLGLLELTSLLCQLQVVSFGDFLDEYHEFLDRCSQRGALDLSLFFCSQKPAIEEILKRQSHAAVRIARARLLGLLNGFDAKLRGGCLESVLALARLRALCFDVIPVSFQGICNRGLREAPGRHFTFHESYVDTSGAVVEVERVSDDVEENGGQSDSSSGSIRCYRRFGGKRRRMETPYGVNGSGEISSVKEKCAKTTLEDCHSGAPSVNELFLLWKPTMVFLQDPVARIQQLTCGDLLKILNTLIGFVLYCGSEPMWGGQAVRKQALYFSNASGFPLAPIVFHRRAKRGALEFSLESSDDSVVCGQEESELRRGLDEEDTIMNETALTDRVSTDEADPELYVRLDEPEATDGCAMVNEVEPEIDAVLSYDAKHTVVAFKELLSNEACRREILLRIIAALREFHVRRQLTAPNGGSSSENYSECLFDLLNSMLKKAVIQLRQNVGQLLKTLPSVLGPLGRYAYTKSTLWAFSPIAWRVPETLETLVQEMDAQEALVAQWKKEGCAEKKPPSDVSNSSSSSLSQVLKECLFAKERSVAGNRTVALALQQHPPSPIAGLLSAKSFQGMVGSLEVKTQKRRRTFISQFLTCLTVERKFKTSSGIEDSEKAEDRQGQDVVPGEAGEGVLVIGGRIFCPPNFGRERKEWFLPTSSSSGSCKKDKTVPEMLKDKWADYKEKVASDENPDNEIEEDEKVVKDQLFQWRCHQLLNLTNLQLYDYSNQDRELRAKIREASIEDLIQAAIQRENASTVTSGAVQMKGDTVMAIS